MDDEPAFQRLGAALLRNFGHDVHLAGDAEQAQQVFASVKPDIVLLDLAMPPSMDPRVGLALISSFKSVPVVVMTGHADHELALEAAALGAWDFLSKPIEPAMLGFVVERGLHKRQMEAELSRLRADSATDDLGLLGQTTCMQQLRAMVRRVAATNVPVMVLGPTGTGKELVARALHQHGAQREQAFVVINCGALSSELLESELFGHVKGSFTGAYRDQPGLVEAAHGGTLFLDEVGEMPQPMQVKLLRFLQEGSFVPVGGRSQKHAHVRIVTATHRDLDAMVAQASFREDLYYRLKGVVLRTPPLAERPADVAYLAARFLRRVAPHAGLTSDALAWLAERNWPGNVRELRAIVESAGALLLKESDSVDADLLRLASGEAPANAAAEQAYALPPGGGMLDTAIAELEQRLIRDALQASGANQSEAARRLGISRVGLIKKIKRLGLRWP